MATIDYLANILSLRNLVQASKLARLFGKFKRQRFSGLLLNDRGRQFRLTIQNQITCAQIDQTTLPSRDRQRCSQVLPDKPAVWLGAAPQYVASYADEHLQHGFILRSGGRGGIRTHGRLAPTPVFKTGALNHSATLPEARPMAWCAVGCNRIINAMAAFAAWLILSNG
jgi:hypothetical protein